MGLKSYNLAHCTILCDGVPMGGFADGDAVTVEYESEIWSDVVGADGEVTRSALNDRRASITFHLKDTSDLNAFFRAKVQLARTVGAGDVFSFFLKDLGLKETVTAREVWVKTDAGTSKAQESGNREWACMGADVSIVQA